MKSWAVSHKWMAASLVVALVVLSVMLVWVETSRAPAPPNGGATPPVGSETTIEGEVVCLPHKDTSGPQTLECAFGVKLAGGTYYGLKDSDETYQNVSSLPVGKKARLTGTLKPESSDRYQSTGTFTVTDAKVVE